MDNMIKDKIVSLFLLLFSLQVFSQELMIKGRVVDDAGEAVIGATVVVKGSQQLGTVTDLDGDFSLKAPGSDAVIVVSYVGMQTKELPARASMKIVLSPDSKELEEVVVTGMLKVDKRLFTGATDQLDATKT